MFYLFNPITPFIFFFFFFNDTATTEIYTLSLHDALPISRRPRARSVARQPRGPRGARYGPGAGPGGRGSAAARARFEPLVAGGARPARPSALGAGRTAGERRRARDRKSTRLNSSHLVISYAVFCLE